MTCVYVHCGAGGGNGFSTKAVGTSGDIYSKFELRKYPNCLNPRELSNYEKTTPLKSSFFTYFNSPGLTQYNSPKTSKIRSL